MKNLRYPVAVSDFDGTLLRSDNTISKQTTKVIKEFIDAGGLFLIATGRMHRAIINRLEEVGLGGIDLPVISYQGAYVKTAISQKILYNKPLDFDLISDVILEARRRKIYIHAYIDDNLYVEKEMFWTKSYTDFLRISFTKVDDLLEFIYKKLNNSQGETHSCHKLLMMMESEKLENELKDFNKMFGGGADFDGTDTTSNNTGKARAIFNTSSNHLLECVSIDAGKDKGIEAVVKNMGYTLNEVLTVGDSLNDYSMVLRAGMGVAVENADFRIKAAAKYIAPSNDDDGVAKAIEKLIFNREG